MFGQVSPDGRQNLLAQPIALFLARRVPVCIVPEAGLSGHGFTESNDVRVFG
jgi:hypothetical protein